MAQVEITINGRDYRIACEDGQEGHLTQLAAYLDGKVGELVDEVGQIGDTSLMVMAGLLVADELSDTREELIAASRGVEERAQDIAADARARAEAEVEARVAAQIDALAARIETLASTVDGDS